MKNTYKILTGIALVVIVAIFISSPVFAEDPPPFLLKWGSYGTGDGQFLIPQGVAVAPSGNVYVAEADDGDFNRIQKFTSSGTFLTKWGSEGDGDGRFFYPSGVAVDPSGNVYVADTENHRIQKFDSNGTFLGKWGSYGTGDGQFQSPYEIAVDPSGNVYVADTFNHRIQKFKPGLDGSYTFETKWGSYGSGDGQVSSPYGIAVAPSGNVYVADTLNHRIQEFTSSGTFLTKWGSEGDGDGQFFYPYGVAVAPSGNVYVSDRNHRIQKFTSNGTFLTKWGSWGSGEGQFAYPFGVAVDPSGNVYVLDVHNHRIQKFGPPAPVCEPITTNDAVNEACCVKDGIYIDPETTAAIKGTYEGDPTVEIDPTKATHGSYVGCVAKKVKELRDAGAIAANEGGEIVRIAAQSDVNKPEGSIH